MRASDVPYRLYNYVLTILLSACLVSDVISQTDLYSSVDYAVHAVCRTPSGVMAGEDFYYIQIDINDIDDAEQDFDIAIGGRSVLQFHVDSSATPIQQAIGPIRHSGNGGDLLKVHVTSLNTGAEDVIMVSQVLCGNHTNNGLNVAGYSCDDNTGMVIAQSQPLASEDISAPRQKFLYVLIDDQGMVLGKNLTGRFDSIPDRTMCTMYAYGVLNSQVDSFDQQIVVGAPMPQSFGDVCGFIHCGSYEVFVRCSGFDLALEKNADTVTVFRLGDTIMYNVKVINQGIMTAYDVLVEDQVPPEMIYLPSLSPLWDMDARSHAIDSIPPGDTVCLPIYFELDRRTPVTQSINRAEIIFAAETPGAMVSAIDEDSTPDNGSRTEDDYDQSWISVFENMCLETFHMEAAIDPICDDSEIYMYSILYKATQPIRYLWIKDGDTLSRESELRISNPTSSDYGHYQLIVKDFNNCEQQSIINANPIDTDHPSCIGDIRVSLSQRCGLRVTPDMMTLSDAPGIGNYEVVVMDHDGSELDVSDLSHTDISEPFEYKLVNPCNGNTVCWGYIHAEYKATPEYDYYTEDISVACALVNGQTPTELIEDYGHAQLDGILSGEQYYDQLQEDVCLIGWEISTEDIYLDAGSMCDTRTVGRIYHMRSSAGKTTVLDTAVLRIETVSIDTVIFPMTVSSVGCSADIDPHTLESYPTIISGMDTILLDAIGYAEVSDKLCNLIISYSDQTWERGCAYGAERTLRQWRITDWCANTVTSDIQYIYRVDDIAPVISLPYDTISMILADGYCEMEIDMHDMVSVIDDCDEHPIVYMSEYAMSADGRFMLGSGTHDMVIVAEDACGNVATKKILMKIKEESEPVPVVISALTLSYSDDGKHILRADAFDNGSHDHGCGPVSIEIARQSELDDMLGQGGAMTPSAFAAPCDEDHTALDDDSDGFIDADEIYRKEIALCCVDIGSVLTVSLRITDQWGNHQDVTATVRINYKGEGDSCDDGDPCTVNDTEIAGCGCVGTPVLSDIDLDDVIDCEDEEITICWQGRTLEIPADSISAYLDMGAVGGSCDDGRTMASIAGMIYTRDTQYVEDVRVTISDGRAQMTDDEGQYLFDDNMMHLSYTLMPYKNDHPLNGVTVSDLHALQYHILGIEPITDPYLKIAADINRDGEISAKDLVVLRKVLLGYDDSFAPYNTSWRFIPIDTTMDVNKPMEIDEMIYVEDLDRDRMHNDWWAVKVGDLTGDARTNSLTANSRSLAHIAYVETPDRPVQAGMEIEIPLRLRDMIDLSAIQWSMILDHFSFVGVSSGSIEISPELFRYDDQSRELRFVISDLTHTVLSDELYTLTLRATTTGMLSDLLTLERGETMDVAYDRSGRGYELQLVYSDAETDISYTEMDLLQNYPNPFSDYTTVAYRLPLGMGGRLTVYLADGTILHEYKLSPRRGYHEVTLTDRHLRGYRGVLYYQLRTDDGRDLTRSMIMSD